MQLINYYIIQYTTVKTSHAGSGQGKRELELEKNMNKKKEGRKKGLHIQQIISVIIHISTIDATTRLLPVATTTALRIAQCSSY
jgi:hypothetical protein